MLDRFADGLQWNSSSPITMIRQIIVHEQHINFRNVGCDTYNRRVGVRHTGLQIYVSSDSSDTG
jgi:hypothetical protein